VYGLRLLKDNPSSKLDFYDESVTVVIDNQVRTLLTYPRIISSCVTEHFLNARVFTCWKGVRNEGAC
jgi:hypothetical protein